MYFPFFVLILFIVFYHKIFAITFDETFARATGVKAGVYNTLIAVLYSSDDRAWNAYDGSIIDLEPDHFPGIDINESVQDI